MSWCWRVDDASRVLHRWLLIPIIASGACAPPSEGVDDAPLTSAEADLLGPNARLWRQSLSLARCGHASVDEDFSSGRFNVHRYAVTVAAGTTAVRLERTGGTFEPALVMASDRVTWEVDESGRGGDVEALRIFADAAAPVDIYVSSWPVVDGGFTTSLSVSAEYRLTVEHACQLDAGDGLFDTARVYAFSADTTGCRAVDRPEDYASGRYNVHRYLTTIAPGAPVEVELVRSAGAYEPAIVVTAGGGDRRLISDGRTGGSAAGILVTTSESGEGASRAHLTIEASAVTEVYVHVTTWAVIASGYQDAIPRDAAYRLSLAPACAPTAPISWAAVHDGLEQGGGSIPRAGLANSTLRSALGISIEPYGDVVTVDGHAFVEGRTSEFGGPNDTGVSATETGAISGEVLRRLNAPLNPSAATLASRPEDYYYVAMRFDYTNVGRAFWANARLLVLDRASGRAVVVRPVDWGPNTSTGRLLDLSPQVLRDLQVATDHRLAVAFAVAGTPLGVVGR